MRLARQTATSFNHVHTESNERRFKIALDAIGEILGMSGNAFARKCNVIGINIHTQTRQVRLTLHFAHATTGGQQRLAGNAAAIDARAAHVATGKDGRF
jgi:hypothetical protein